MIRYIRLLCVVVSICFNFYQLKADPTFGLPDSLSSEAKISIVVASPSAKEVYTFYGHAAIRVQDIQQGLDVAINYGIFDFKDDFIYRFVRGETDYIALPESTQDYMQEYLGRGSRVVELMLNLDGLQRAKMWQYLLWNIQPQNRTYRYNFFYDNCATRPYTILRDILNPDTLYIKGAEQLTEKTWREQINELEQASPWLVLGTDLCLGVPTDRRMTKLEGIFLPHLLVELLESAQLVSDGKSVPIVLGRQDYLPEQEAIPSVSLGDRLFSPVVVFSLLLLFSLWWCWRSYRGYTPSYLFDGLLFTILGLGGVLLFFLTFISTHPHTSPNLNLWVIHPLHLFVGLPALLLGKRLRATYLYHFVNFVIQLVFILASVFLPQHFNTSVYLLSLSLIALSGGRIFGEYRSAWHPQ